jgi:hypothetical protein
MTDPSLKSFVSTLKNPHNFAARRYVLDPQKKDRAICCCWNNGQIFLGGIGISDKWNTNTNSFGKSYTNDTGPNADTFFTGSKTFEVKQIEVFEIIV